MRILCIGDVVGSRGCTFVREKVPALKKHYGIDAVICNGENSADGNGVLPTSADSLFASGVDVITLGNHSFRRKEIYSYLEESPFIIRPINYPASTTPGAGKCVLDLGRSQVTVINLMGNVYFGDNLNCPFETMDKVLSEVETKIVIVDFHAEATGEKGALAHYLDGRVSAVFGTHTHVQTADEQILPKGTGFITDVGMTGPVNSVLGVKSQLVIDKLKCKLPVRFEVAQNPYKLDAIIFDIDDSTGKCRAVERISVV
ncbi:MAG: TIGR00282 family metallophosphoesterase [Clostridia bacterium]|nr:TIGR00282 family metallophosphoesterase [Clostridia bacterium]